MSEILTIVGNRIKSLRTSKKLSQEELALMANIDPTHLGRVERGESNCSIEMLYKLINALNISFEDFFRETQTSNTDNETFPVIIDRLIALNEEEQQCILELVNTAYKLMKKE